MEQLTVYADYVQTQSLLRAARNRVLNATHTIASLAPPQQNQCRTDAASAYTDHLLRSQPALDGLAQAIASRVPNRVLAAVRVLHLYNRATVRLTRVMEADITDDPIDPDKFYPHGDDGPSIPPPPVKPSTPITARKFAAKLHAALEVGRSY